MKYVVLFYVCLRVFVFTNIFFGCNVRSCDFNVLLVLLLPILVGVKHAKVKGLLILFGCMLGHFTHARVASM
jgi:hypothetical protein